MQITFTFMKFIPKKIKSIILSLVEIAALSEAISICILENWHFSISITLVALGIFFLLYKHRSNQRYAHQKILFFFIFILFIFRATIVWGLVTFPLDEPLQVIITLTLPLNGFVEYFVENYIFKVLLTGLFIAIFLTQSFSCNIAKSKHPKILLSSIAFFLITLTLCEIALTIPIKDYCNLLANTKPTHSTFFKDNYVFIDSTMIQPMSKTQNLIFIIMESMDHTFADKANGGEQEENLIRELTTLEKDEINFSHNELFGGGATLNGTTPTISATISKTTGCPLFISRSIGQSLLANTPSIYNIMKNFHYENVFIQGTDATFANLESFLNFHGIDKIYDSKNLKGNFEKNEKYNNNTLTDRSVLEISRKILDTLSQKEHFSLTIATIETHAPSGFFNDACEEKPQNRTEAAHLAATIRCASKDVRNFINWVKQQDFYKNTEIVVVGDHPFPMQHLSKKNYTDKKWIDLFINSQKKPIQVKNRDFSSMDIAPSILESIGFEIHGHKMGFGTSLFSDERTLLEQNGSISLNQSLSSLITSYEYNALSLPQKN